MTDTKSPKTEQRSKEQKGNLGQKEAQLEKEKNSDLSHMGEKSRDAIKKSG